MNQTTLGPCLEAEDMLALVEGNVRGERYDGMMAHIAECGSCRFMYRELADVETLVRERGILAPEEADERLPGKTDKDSSVRVGPRRWWTWAVPAFAAAILIIAFLSSDPFKGVNRPSRQIVASNNTKAVPVGRQVGNQIGAPIRQFGGSANEGLGIGGPVTRGSRSLSPSIKTRRKRRKSRFQQFGSGLKPVPRSSVSERAASATGIEPADFLSDDAIALNNPPTAELYRGEGDVYRLPFEVVGVWSGPEGVELSLNANGAYELRGVAENSSGEYSLRVTGTDKWVTLHPKTRAADHDLSAQGTALVFGHLRLTRNGQARNELPLHDTDSVQLALVAPQPANTALQGLPREVVWNRPAFGSEWVTIRWNEDSVALPIEGNRLILPPMAQRKENNLDIECGKPNGRLSSFHFRRLSRNEMKKVRWVEESGTTNPLLAAIVMYRLGRFEDALHWIGLSKTSNPKVTRLTSAWQSVIEIEEDRHRLGNG